MSWIYQALRRAGNDFPDVGKVADLTTDTAADCVKSKPCTADENSVTCAAPTVAQCGSNHISFAESLGNSWDVPAEVFGVGPRIGVTPRIISRNGFRHLKVNLADGSRLSYFTDPSGMVAEQYRFIRRSLTQSFPDGAALMISSPGPGDGKTLTTLNLCTALADAAKTTLLVEVDVRQPAARRMLGCARTTPALEDALTGKVDAHDAVEFVDGLGFHAALVSNTPADPPHLISGQGIRDFIMWARKNFHWVVLDAPPVLPVADVAELLPLSDAVLMLVRAEKTRRDLCKRAIEVVGKRLHAVILNEGNLDCNPYYRYLGSYYRTNGNHRGTP
jgi:Mrp family chromosome partitioning ATPase